VIKCGAANLPGRAVLCRVLCAASFLFEIYGWSLRRDEPPRAYPVRPCPPPSARLTPWFFFIFMQIMDVAALAQFLSDRIKVDGKTGM